MDILEPYPPPGAYPTHAMYEAARLALRERKVFCYRSVIDLFLRRNRQPEVFRDLHVNRYPQQTETGNCAIEIGGLHLGKLDIIRRSGPKLPAAFADALRSEMQRYLHAEFLDLRVIRANFPSRLQFVFRTEEAAERFIEAFCTVR